MYNALLQNYIYFNFGYCINLCINLMLHLIKAGLILIC